ncbi:biopolymer transporter ExbD [Opitutales bacterium]|nr:biopolymer transporter ExbD [Opitutales bacterium]MDG1173588.1 biopolymer transporter ExbD [Opitutales bacterium]
MRSRSRNIENSEADAINVSPLIDVVFILLIFFIVSATFVTLPGIEVTRPQAVTGKALEKNAVIFALSGKNEIKYAGSSVQLEEIPGLVELASKDKGKPVVIQVDQWADASILAKVVAQARKKSGVVSIATRKPKS